MSVTPADPKTGKEALALYRATARRMHEQLHAAPKPGAKPPPPPPPDTSFVSRWPRQKMIPGQPVFSILKLSALYFNLPLADVRSTKRHHNIVLARQVAYYVARVFGLSLPRIGLGADRDHSSVLHGCQVINNLIQTGDKDVIAAVNTVGSTAAAAIGITWTPVGRKTNGQGIQQ
jgi:hypothetical protein